MTNIEVPDRFTYWNVTFNDGTVNQNFRTYEEAKAYALRIGKCRLNNKDLQLLTNSLLMYEHETDKTFTFIYVTYYGNLRTLEIKENTFKFKTPGKPPKSVEDFGRIENFDDLSWHAKIAFRNHLIYAFKLEFEHEFTTFINDKESLRKIDRKELRRSFHCGPTVYNEMIAFLNTKLED